MECGMKDQWPGTAWHLRTKKKINLHLFALSETTGSFSLLFGPVGTFSNFLMIRSPSIILLKTTCFLLSESHLEHVMKNWQPLGLGLLLPMDSKPGTECFSWKFSWAKGHSGVISIYKITFLDHEILYNPVKSVAFVTDGNTIFS